MKNKRESNKYTKLKKLKKKRKNQFSLKLNRNKNVWH